MFIFSGHNAIIISKDLHNLDIAACFLNEAQRVYDLMDRNRGRLTQARYEGIDLNLRALDIFVQVAEGGGISKTAQRMALTQSAVSQSIAGLEQSLGVQLFDRNVRPIALTPSGSILLDKARGVLLCAREALQAVRKPPAAALPRLNICLIGAIAGRLGLELLSSFEGFAATWSVNAGLYNQHARSLLTREADIMISPDPLEDEPNLERHLILREPLCLVLPADWKEQYHSLAELAGKHDLVRLSSRTKLGQQVDRHLRRMRVETKARVEFDDPEAVMAMVAANMGWAILTPVCMLLGRSYWPKIRVLPMPGPGASREIHVIAREKELGDIPRGIAAKCIAALHQVFHTEMETCCPWILDECYLPGICCKPPLKAAAQPSASSAQRWPSQDLIPSGKLARSS